MVVSGKALANTLKDIENYFQVSKKIKKSGEPLDGIISIVLQLAIQSNKTALLGSSAVEKALVHQWLEYASLYSSYLDKSQSVIHQVLRELNGVLTRQEFLVKSDITVADIVLFYLIWNIMASMSLQEKEQYISLSRWFNTLQQDDKLRQSKRVICFSRTPLYP